MDLLATRPVVVAVVKQESYYSANLAEFFEPVSLVALADNIPTASSVYTSLIEGLPLLVARFLIFHLCPFSSEFDSRASSNCCPPCLKQQPPSAPPNYRVD